MRYTIIGIVALFATVILAGVFYFKNINEENLKDVQALEFLPEDGILSASFSSDASTQNLFKDYAGFEYLFGKKRWASLKSLYNQFTQDFTSSSKKQNEIHVSFHNRENKIETLFLTLIDKKTSRDQLQKFIQNGFANYVVQSIDTMDFTTYTINDTTQNIQYFLGYEHPVLALSSSSSLLMDVFDERTSKTAKNDIAYAAKHKRDNTAVNYTLFLKNISSLHSVLTEKEESFVSQFLKEIDGTAALSQNYKSDVLILVGQSRIIQENAYLSLFINQQKKEQILTSYFPHNTAMYWEFSLSNKADFKEKLRKQQKENQLLEKIEKDKQELEKKHGKSFYKLIDEHLGNHFALVQQNNGEELVFLSLQEVNENFLSSDFFSDLKEDSIKRWNYPSILTAEYGDVFKNLSRPYVFVYQDVLILSNRLNTLREYISSLKNNRLLNGSVSFKNYEKIKSESSNITFFMDQENSKRLLNQNLRAEVKGAWQDEENYGFHNFQTWSFQLDGKNDGFYTNLYGIYKSEDALGLEPEWSYSLSEKALTPPYIFEHSDTSQFIFFQELNHRVHALSPEGKKKWDAVFHGRIVGDAIQHSDRSILLVTDKNQLYRFRPDGKAYPGFSLTLPQKPLSGVKILHIQNEPVIAIPTQNKIMLYSLQGNKINDYDPIELKNQKIQDVFTIHNDLAIGTQEGNIDIYNKNGQQKTALSSKSKGKIQSPYFVDDSRPNFMVWSADDLGNIWQYNEEETKLLFSVPTQDKKTEINYDIQGQKLIIAHSNGIELFSSQSNESHKSIPLTLTHFVQPQIFPNQSIGIASGQNQLIYVFSKEGSLLNGFPIEGLPNFYYGKINYNSGKYTLTFKRDHTLYAYPDHRN